MTEESQGQDVVQVPEPVTEKKLETETKHTLYLASWSTRFWAWLIDVILVILFTIIVQWIFLPFWTISFYGDLFQGDLFVIGVPVLFFFLYWMLMEGYWGQSVGKMVMNLKVVNRNGSGIHFGTAAIESLGKAFFPVLILDCLIGWLGMPSTKLRVFNRISNTIVIKIDYKEPEGIVYVSEKE
jgi:uncharacterized RDD family membrane protein YckC